MYECIYTCINVVQHRTCWFFLGVGEFTPNAAIEGDMGWLQQEVRQWNSVLKLGVVSRIWMSVV